ncbi:hypothetical protein QVD17_41952 [Tagetes erecta]|uniref:Uncharacterized protein n=1 Tax=Tagetes erecta TaxID=13708 RepID=A0AAD8JQ12_TARER|nr:hypothetical protein QVD17_41952 [Tagetes erecta]
MSSQTPLDPISFIDTPNQFGLLPEEQVVDNWMLDQLPSTYPQETLEPWTNFCEEPNTWNFSTLLAPLKIQKTIPFGEGTSRSRKPRIRIHPIQETFSYSLKDVEEANLKENDTEFAANHKDVWPTSSIYHEIFTGRRDPPPPYKSTGEHNDSVLDMLDRSVPETDSLNNLQAEEREKKVHAGEGLCEIGSWLEHKGMEWRKG